ncbi:hypothetical protein BHM03_00032917 [Ensete ventricosum]|nr:hypothetical protein BHM03_00032917 [Ensete ventricosum]
MSAFYSELQKLHKELVIGNVLTESEFWATRKVDKLINHNGSFSSDFFISAYDMKNFAGMFWMQNLLDDDSDRTLKQRTGFKSAMLADIRPSTDGRVQHGPSTNKVTFSLTPEIIHQIFAEKPAVHRAFLNFVPSKMTEKDFWTKYCRAEYLHRTKNSVAAAAEAAEDEELAVFLKHDDILADEARRKLECVENYFSTSLSFSYGNMARAVNFIGPVCFFIVNFQDHGILRDGCKEIADSENDLARRTLAQDVNRHAAVVLEGRALDIELGDTRAVAEALARSKQGGTGAGSKTIDYSLNTEEAYSYLMHQISEIARYWVVPSIGAISSPLSFEIGRQRLISSIAARHRAVLAEGEPRDPMPLSLDDPDQSQDATDEVLSGLTQQISSTRYHLGKNPQESVLDRLPKRTKDEIMLHWTSIQELLRHFWSSYPITTSYLYNKVIFLILCYGGPQVEECYDRYLSEAQGMLLRMCNQISGIRSLSLSSPCYRYPGASILCHVMSVSNC